MPELELVTPIAAPVERVFDLSRSIDLHMDSTSSTREKAVAGVTSGLIGQGQQVTWRACHFGIWWSMTVKIGHFQYPEAFTDAMVSGPFHYMVHSHRFVAGPDGGTIMTDHFSFASPLGILGGLADRLFVGPHLLRFLEERNRVIREAAESEAWRKYLPATAS